MLRYEMGHIASIVKSMIDIHPLAVKRYFLKGCIDLKM